MAMIRGKIAATVAAAGIALVAFYEGYHPVAYKDPIGIVTVCYGHTATAQLGQRLSKDECTALLRTDLAEAERAVVRYSKAHTQEQFDALVSFTFNVGSGNLAKSTLLRHHNAGSCLAAGAEFPKWNKAGGKVLPGLTKRRNAERELYEKGCHAARTPGGPSTTQGSARSPPA